jgi:hypothetical protein
MTSQGTVLAPVYPSISYEELGRLLREAGYDIEPVENGGRPTYRTLNEPRFMIRLVNPVEQRPGEFKDITVWTRVAVSPAELADVIHRTKAQNVLALLLADRIGHLVVIHEIMVAGGVTPDYLKSQFFHWRTDLQQVLGVVRESQGKSEGRLN